MDNRSPEDAHQWAEESVARRFSWEMNAATSRYGLLADIIFAFLVSAIFGLLFALAAHFKFVVAAWVLGILAGLAPVVCAVAHVQFRSARGQVVEWIASQPFEIWNINALLAWMGENFEIYFESAVPSRDELMQSFEPISQDMIVLETHLDEKMVVGRFGVIDSKHNPLKGAQARYVRLRELTARSLVPLHQRYPICRLVIV